MIRTKKWISSVVIIVLSLSILGTGCTTKAEKNVEFTAVIESVSEGSIMVTTDDDVGFDKASVSTSGADIDFEPAAGQKIFVIIKPEIRESYPVQTTGVKLRLADSGQTGTTKPATGQAPEASQASAKAPEYIKISAEEAKKIIDSGVPHIVLDVRTQEEYDSGHIQDAVLLPNETITAEEAARMLPEKNAKILVYCRSGNRSAQASKKLIALGYTDVQDFGGISGWTYDIVK